MTTDTRKVLLFLIKIITDKPRLLFWLLIRFVSALLPLITIYQFSVVVQQLEIKAPLNNLLLTLLLLLIVRLVDNYLRLISVTRLDNAISSIGFDIHNYFLADTKAESKEDRHSAIQAIRNFADASTLTFSLLKQPGVDSFISLLIIPVIIFTRDFPSFILCVAYIVVYYFIDIFTTQHYSYLKDILNTKTESYYGRLQDTNDFDLEQKAWGRHFNRLCHWSFTEWFVLQNFAVILYCLIFTYLAYTVIIGQKHISELVLIMGYVTQIQTHLNAFSQIKDSLTDMMVGLQHLAKNSAVSVLNLDDLI